MENVKERLANALFGRSRKDDACVMCGNLAVERQDFKDELSWKEWGISRMCQDCQDGIFNDGIVLEE
jgi:hypothetical protein